MWTQIAWSFEISCLWQPTLSTFVAQRDAIDQIFVMLGSANPLMRTPTP